MTIVNNPVYHDTVTKRQAVPLWPQSGPEAFFSRRRREKTCWSSLPKPGEFETKSVPNSGAVRLVCVTIAMLLFLVFPSVCDAERVM